MQEAQLRLSQSKAKEAMADVDKAESRISRLERQVHFSKKERNSKILKASERLLQQMCKVEHNRVIQKISRTASCSKYILAFWPLQNYLSHIFFAQTPVFSILHHCWYMVS